MSSERRSLSTLLLALQYGDSAFPSGGFAQSWGLETAAAERWLGTAADLEAACRAALRFQVAPTDAVAAAGCCVAASVSDIPRVIAIDHRLTATRAARETREASLRLGRRLIESAATNEGDEVLQELFAGVRDGSADGNHATILGALAGRGGMSPNEAAAFSLWGAANGLLGAALRLLPIAHTDVQAILVGLRPLIANLATAAAAADPLWIAGTAPMFEIWSMRHETGSVRLFAS